MLSKKNKDPKTWSSSGVTGKYLKKEAPPSDVPSNKELKIIKKFTEVTYFDIFLSSYQCVDLGCP